MRATTRRTARTPTAIACPTRPTTAEFTPNPDQTDGDGDGTGDACETIDPDQDGDGRFNEADNCPAAANPDQADADGDGTGDLCDPTPFPDADGDGALDGADNCATVPNADQRDADGDGTGDACDPTPNGPDEDGDGAPDAEDNCPATANPDQSDRDGDGTGDACEADGDGDGVADDTDNCPAVPNSGQDDRDGDGVGDACEADGDGDGVPDDADNCPAAANLDQDDADGDGIGDACEPDRDGDGTVDDLDNCPAEANPDQADADGDGLGDTCDEPVVGSMPDPDGDGVRGDFDNCPLVANPDQADRDRDGVGDACEPPEAAPSVLDVLEGDPRLGTFAAAVRASGLADLLDDPEAALTVFAPVDGAFDDLYPELRAAVLEDPDERRSMVQSHVLDIGGLGLAELLAASNELTLNAYELSFDVPQGGELFVNDAVVVDGDVAAGASVVHVLDRVLSELVDRCLDEDDTDTGGFGGTDVTDGTGAGADSGGATGGDTTGPGAGRGDGCPGETMPPPPVAEPTTEELIAARPELSRFLTLFRTSLGAALDDPNNAWTVFAPTNDALDDGVIETLTADPSAGVEFLLEHIAVSGALDADALSGLGEVVVNTGLAYSITGDGDRLEINGVPIVGPAARTVGGSVVHPIGGTLP